MQDRLAELLRQRALVAEHLAWLDREIASVASAATAVTPPIVATPADGSPSAAKSGPAPSAVLPTPTLPPLAAAATAPVLPEIALHEVDPKDIRAEARKGCFLYIFIATIVIALCIWLMVWASRSEWVQKEAGPYILRASIVAGLLLLGAWIRGQIAKRISG